MVRVEVVRIALGCSVAYALVKGPGVTTLLLNTDPVAPEKRGGGVSTKPPVTT